MKRILLIVVLLFAGPVCARAQSAADSAGVLLGVATRLNAEGNVQLSRSLLDLIISRYGNTPAASEAARLRAVLKGPSTQQQGGRTELMVFGTTYGAWLGVAIPIIAGADNAAPYGVGLIAGGPVGFLAARAYARSHTLTDGQARAITFGGMWGSWQGMGWANVFDFGRKTSCDEFGCFTDKSPTTEAAVASTVVGGLAGIGIGSVLAHRHITPGTATTVNFGGLWGTWYGAALATAGNASSNKTLTAALVAGDLGILGAAIGAPRWQLSRPRARLISISGLAGGLAGAGILLIAQPNTDSNAAILLPAAASAVGLGLGAYWTRKMPQEDALTTSPEKKLGFLDLPAIGPRMIERVRGGQRERVPGLGITLQARF